MKRMKFLLPLLTAFIGTNAAAQTESYEYSAAKTGRAMQVVLNKAIVGESAMPCRAKTVFRYDASRIVATCVDKPGLLVVDVSEPTKPQPIEIWGYEGKLLDVYLVGDKVWMDIKGQGSSPLVLQTEAPVEPPREEAVVVVEAPRVIETPTEPKTPEATLEVEVEAAAPIRIGKVLKVDNRDIVVDFGTEDGFKKGDDVEFYSTREIQLEGERVKRDDTVAVGRIKSIDVNRAVIEVGMNEDVSIGTPARYTATDYKANHLAPPRNGDSDEISVTVRPYLALGSLGGGAIMDASWMHRFESPIAVELSISPGGFAITDQGSAAAFAGHGFVTYDARVFQVGLGLGVARFKAKDLPYELGSGDTMPETMEFGVSAGQYVRLGARDGFSLTMTTNFVVRDKQWDFGGITSELQVPLGKLLPDTWMILRGGGGLPGHIFGEMGLRTMVRGNGNTGSVFVTPLLGFGSITTPEYEDCGYRSGSQCLVDNDYGGPMVGVTVEWRP